MKVSKKTIIIALSVTILILSAVIVIISSHENRESGLAPTQSREETTPEDSQDDEPAGEGVEKINQDNSVDVPEEAPPQEVDDRGGYTPY